MRAGGGAVKGSSWERELCKMLSLWISRGASKDLFERNVGSGGAFTSAARRGTQRGVPGDLMSVHPLSYEFLQNFFVEAKSWRNLDLDRALWNKEKELYRVICKQEELAIISKRIFLLIAKQNRRRPLVFMPAEAGMYIFGKVIERFDYHLLWRERILLYPLDQVLKTDPDVIVKLAELYRLDIH